MKRYLWCVWLIAAAVWILLTDGEESRQFEYDNGIEI